MSETSALRIGVAGPVSLDLLDYPEGLPGDLPLGYPAPIVAHFVNALLRRGHKVVVFTTSRGLETPWVIDQDSLKVCVAPRYRPRSALLFFRRERKWLRALMRQYPCDLIHSMWSYEFSLAAMQTRVPTVVHYHDHAWTILKHAPDAYRFLRWLLSSYVDARAKNRIANSAYLKGVFGKRGRNMCIIPNFLPDATFARLASLPVNRTPALVTVSNGFGGCKNVAAALEAWPSIRRAGVVSEYRLVGVGMGPGEEAESFAVERGLAEGVKFIGEVSFTRALEEIQSSALLLHPALEESFGMTILEAMAARTPVVAGSQSGNVPDLLDHGACGYLCDARDAASIADSVIAALTDSAETLSITEKAYRRAHETFSESRVVEELERYYSDMLDKTVHRRGRGRPR